MTLGEFRVGIAFNPGGNPEVTAIKKAAASFIDLVEQINTRGDVEVARLMRLAQEYAEVAAMWAVKAATKPVR